MKWECPEFPTPEELIDAIIRQHCISHGVTIKKAGGPTALGLRMFKLSSDCGMLGTVYFNCATERLNEVHLIFACLAFDICLLDLQNGDGVRPRELQ